jgi:Peptidase family M1 domain
LSARGKLPGNSSGGLIVLSASRLALIFLAGLIPVLSAQTPTSPDEASAVYRQLQPSSLSDKSVHLENAVVHRDRVTLTFTNGTIYFAAPAEGKVRSAVFIGSGKFQASPPPVPFEQENVRRLLKADDVSSDFKTAVLRFTDDTAAELLGQGGVQTSAVSEEANHLASELEPRLLKETGMNISARQMEAILNREKGAVFLAQLAGGKRGRFTYLFDPESRIPVSSFGIDAGEKGVIFAYDDAMFSNDVWMAFYADSDYAVGEVPYSDTYNLVSTERYTLVLDLTEPKKVLGLTATLDLTSRVDGLELIPFNVGQGLNIYDDERRKKQLHVLGAHLSDGTALTFFQESWEEGFSVVLPKAIAKGQTLSLVLELKGDFMEAASMEGMYFPRSTTTWYPRHGYLSRSRFDVSMIHRKKDHVVSIGDLIREGPAPGAKDYVLTEFRMDQPVALATFAVGPYEIHKDVAKEDNGKQLPIEFYSLPGSEAAIKEDFILAEMNNSVSYFSKMFGEYPYSLFRGVYHPFGFGQGFPTTIMIPAADSANNWTFSFIAHETSHQWWGDMVLWRSYRDQWLSEGFAEYSGMLYDQLRDKKWGQKELIERARSTLKQPPRTLQGIGTGRLVDVGPLVLGRRLESRETRGAYTALTYEKGALVLRMMHYLFTDPLTGDGGPFFELMRDFVRRYNGSTATTDQFFALANERVRNTSLSKKYGYQDLNWFYRQWVSQTYLPSYQLTYHIEQDPSGSVMLKGEVSQSGLPENEKWFMPLPLLLRFPGGKAAHGSVAVLGTHTPVNIKLPQMPEKVELDPEMWILSDKTSTAKQ